MNARTRKPLPDDLEKLEGRLLTYEQVKELTGLGTNTVISLVRESGALVKIGGASRADWTILRAYIDEMRVKKTDAENVQLPESTVIEVLEPSSQNQVCGNMYKTYDLEQFKTLNGNRDVTEERVKKVQESMLLKQLPIPIVVNEKKEVIDGQARLEVCKRNNMPIYFVIAEGLDINDCVTANIYSTNWNITDIINRYAKTGNKNCIRIMDVCGMFSVDYKTVMLAAGRGQYNGSARKAVLAQGNINFSEQDKWLAVSRLQKSEDVIEIFGDKNVYQKQRLRQAIIKCCKDPQYDHQRMIMACRKNASDYKNSSKTSGVLQELARFYNKGKRNNYMDVYGEGSGLTLMFDAKENRFK